MHRARSRAAKIAVIAVELVGGLLAVGAACVALLYWRLQSGPLSLAFFEESAEYAISRSLAEGYAVDLSDTAIVKANGEGRYDVTIARLVVRDAHGVGVSDISGVSIEYSVPDLFRAAVHPKRVVIEEARLDIERRAAPSLEKAQSANPARGRNRFARAYSRFVLASAPDSAEVKSLHIAFRDAVSGKSWETQRAAAKFERFENGIRVNASAAFDVDGADARFDLRADYSEEENAVIANVDLSNAPVGDLLEILYGPNAGVFSAPVSGRASLTMSPSGKVLASRIDARVGSGVARLGARRLAIDAIDLHATFDPERDLFEIDALDVAAGGTRVAVAGEATLDFEANSRLLQAIRFDVNGENLVADLGPLLPQPLAIDRARLAGGYQLRGRRFDANLIEAQLLGVVVKGEALYMPAAGGGASEERRLPRIKAKVAIEGALDPERILLGWPTTIGLGAREFISTRLPAARIDNVALTLDLPEGALEPDRPFPDEALDLAFEFADATIIYAQGMTPLTKAKGKAKLTGNRFHIAPVEGRVGAVALSGGEVDFTALSPRGRPVYYRFKAKGEAKDILSVLNEEPLGVLNATGLDPSRFVGEALVEAEIVRPNLRDVPQTDYRYSGTVTFDDITLTEFFAGVDVAGARGRIDVETRKMLVVADAHFGESPIKLTWRENFYAQDGPSTVEITGVLDSTTGDIFGVGSRQNLLGPVSFRANANGSLRGINVLDLHFDFAEATVIVDPFGWKKPAGTEGFADLSLAFSGDSVEVRSAIFAGDGIDIKGRGRFGPHGYIESLAVDRFYLEGGADFALTAERAESGILEIVSTGRYLNAASFVEDILDTAPRAETENGAFGWGAGAVISGRFDELGLRGGTAYKDASLDLRRGAVQMEEFQFSARAPGGEPLSVDLKQTGSAQGPRQMVEARTSDIGSLLAGVFDISSVRGGEGFLEILVAEKNAASGGFSGMMEARGIRVVKAPLLARIFAAGSFDGLSDLLNGEGISLSEAHARFSFKDGVFSITNARATGPSVGITGEGVIDTGDAGKVSLSGAVAPAYQVNSLLGKTPIIGDILVNREGEGVVALSYTVSGEAAAPMVTVNPLSALTPGVLRRMFEGRETLPEEPASPSPAARPPPTD